MLHSRILKMHTPLVFMGDVCIHGTYALYVSLCRNTHISSCNAYVWNPRFCALQAIPDSLTQMPCFFSFLVELSFPLFLSTYPVFPVLGSCLTSRVRVSWGEELHSRCSKRGAPAEWEGEGEVWLGQLGCWRHMGRARPGHRVNISIYNVSLHYILY